MMTYLRQKAQAKGIFWIKIDQTRHICIQVGDREFTELYKISRFRIFLEYINVQVCRNYKVVDDEVFELRKIAWIEVCKVLTVGEIVLVGIFTVQIASGKSIRLGSRRLGFDSKSGQTNDFEIGIHSFPAWGSALKGQSGEQLTGKFACCAVGKVRSGIPPSRCGRQMACNAQSELIIALSRDRRINTQLNKIDINRNENDKDAKHWATLRLWAPQNLCSIIRLNPEQGHQGSNFPKFFITVLF